MADHGIISLSARGPDCPGGHLGQPRRDGYPVQGNAPSAKAMTANCVPVAPLRLNLQAGPLGLTPSAAGVPKVPSVLLLSVCDYTAHSDLAAVSY